MTAGSIVAGVESEADEVEQVSRRQLKAEAKAAARAERNQAKADARAAKQAKQAESAEQVEVEGDQPEEPVDRAEAKRAARAARRESKVAKVKAKEASRRERDEARKRDADARRQLRMGTSAGAAVAGLGDTPIADALSAELPPPAKTERPLADMADNEREIQQRREAEEAAKAARSRAARRAKAAEAKQATRRAREEAKAAKAEARAAKAAAKAEVRDTAALDQPDTADSATPEVRASAAETSGAGVTARTEPSSQEPAESTPVDPSDVHVTFAGESRIEQEIAKAKERVEADARSRDIEEAARRDRAEAEAKAREVKEEARREREAAKAEAAKAKAAARAEREAAKAEAAKAKADQRRERDEAKAAAKTAARRERDDAPVPTAKSKGKPVDDKIVEPPRKPKIPLAQRLRQGIGGKDADPDAPAGTTGRNALAVLAVVLGTVGFICSVILAIGAFLVALSPHADSAAFHKISSVCDALVGPLRDVFSFSGVNGDSKNALVAWGLGALGYLIIGLFAQTFLRSHAEEHSS